MLVSERDTVIRRHFFHFSPDVCVCVVCVCGVCVCLPVISPSASTARCRLVGSFPPFVCQLCLGGAAGLTHTRNRTSVRRVEKAFRSDSCVARLQLFHCSAFSSRVPTGPVVPAGHHLTGLGRDIPLYLQTATSTMHHFHFPLYSFILRFFDPKGSTKSVFGKCSRLSSSFPPLPLLAPMWLLCDVSNQGRHSSLTLTTVELCTSDPLFSAVLCALCLRCFE